MRVKRQRSQTRLAPLFKIILSLVVIVGVSFSLAWVWHTTQLAAEDAGADLQAPDPAVNSAEAAALPSLPRVAPQEPSGTPEPAPEQSAAPEPEPPQTTAGAVALSGAVDSSYFDDAIFFGDSISTGIPLYHMADNAAVVAMTGINPDNINYRQAIDTGEEERVTLLQAAAAHGERGKVYIMLGGNGLGLDMDAFIRGYKTFLDSVQQQYPGAVIYLQSITPVVEGYQNEFVPDIDNDKIDEYNREILALAQREGVYYLDVASALKDPEGNLPTEASPVDGMHFTPEYYTRWFDYLKTHTVQTQGQ